MTAVSTGFRRSYTCLAIALIWTVFAGSAAAQRSIPECSDPQTCRELALEARAQGSYETFHDLAWRAVQTGRPNDPDLMYLLARAQALSGRRRDAVVMLRRLAEAGFANDAATDDDFRRVRELPDWAYIASLASRARPAAPPAAASVPPPSKPAASPAPPAAAPPAASAAPAKPSPAPVAPIAPIAPIAPPAPATPAVRPLRREPAAVEDVVRFSTGPFTPSGLAYDVASRRLLFGDLTGRRLFVVGEGSDRAVDLVRADSTGFDDVTAIAIDAKRGELWVASTTPDGSSGAIHRLQLISGRAVGKFPVPGAGSMRLSDLAVATDGTVFILDSEGRRISRFRAGLTTVELVITFKTPEPVSMAVDDSGRVAYLAHADGIARLDLQTRRASPVSAANGIALRGIDHLRLHRSVLIGSQLQPDGTRGLVRLQLNRARDAIAAATLIDEPSFSDQGGTTGTTISGDDFYYLVTPRPENKETAAGGMEVRVRRIRLE